MASQHRYRLSVEWTGNRGNGTSGYRDFDRAHEIRARGKPSIAGSADPAFRGEPDRWNPEELLVASLSECHMLWYLHLAASAGIVVTAYVDEPVGTMAIDGPTGSFSEVVLHPKVTLADPALAEKALALHSGAHAYCFIARSMNFPVRHQPVIAEQAP